MPADIQDLWGSNIGNPLNFEGFFLILDLGGGKISVTHLDTSGQPSHKDGDGEFEETGRVVIRRNLGPGVVRVYTGKRIIPPPAGKLKHIKGTYSTIRLLNLNADKTAKVVILDSGDWTLNVPPPDPDGFTNAKQSSQTGEAKKPDKKAGKRKPQRKVKK